MFTYTVIQWLFLFYFYCFFGWCFESSYVSIKSRKLVNRGFMKGPFLPLYGSGAIMMLLVSRPFTAHWWAVYIAGCIGATALEYVTGVVMEALFKVRYWDYSNQPFNFQGHICLGSSLAWGGLTLLMTYVVQEPVERIMLAIPPAVLSILTILLTVYIVSDFTLSFKEALDLRDVLVRTEKAREELERMQKRLDVLIAVKGEEWAVKKEALAEKLRAEELRESVERSLRTLKESIFRKPGSYSEDEKEEILHLHTKFELHAQSDEKTGSVKAWNRLLRGNPTMSSSRYREALEELKKKVKERKK